MSSVSASLSPLVVSSSSSSAPRALGGGESTVVKIPTSARYHGHHSLRFSPNYNTPTTLIRSRKISLFQCSALSPELKTTLDKFVTSEKVIVFMKGTKDFPQCGFSNTVVQILKSLNAPFETVNILDNELLRQGLKEYSQWPTFPQLYIDGEFFGGCDITVEAYKSGELQEVLEKVQCS